ncbi:hypothetical protein ES703_08282 [subsurface metagenome]
MKRYVTTRTCPSCQRVRLDFTQNLDHLGQPIGGITAWCWVCSRGYYLRSNRVHDIGIRCALCGEIVPAYRCLECPTSSECLKRQLLAPTTIERPPLKVRPEVVIYG